ncbi:hypothetical protein BVRB_2g035930 [Beta vulgaris subsp. vulgaris]|nr:hypothetical protein BVRB_2g035930 [Beta vulgaris subsp. vulgaris]
MKMLVTLMMNLFMLLPPKPPQFPSSPCFQAALLDYSLCENGEGVRQAFAPSMADAIELSPVPLQVIYPENYCQGNSFGPLARLADQNYGGFSTFDFGVENDTMVILDDEKFGSGIQLFMRLLFSLSIRRV